jgi:hypothetical protein
MRAAPLPAPGHEREAKAGHRDPGEAQRARHLAEHQVLEQDGEDRREVEQRRDADRLSAALAAIVLLAGDGTMMNAVKDGLDSYLMVGGNDPVVYFAAARPITKSTPNTSSASGRGRLALLP